MENHLSNLDHLEYQNQVVHEVTKKKFQGPALPLFNRLIVLCCVGAFLVVRVKIFWKLCVGFGHLKVRVPS